MMSFGAEMHIRPSRQIIFRKMVQEFKENV